jgi:DNA topoisomerase-1
VTDGTVNATIPKGTDPASVSLEEAVKLLTAREEKMRAQGKDPSAKRSRTTRKKTTRKKTTKKSAKQKSTRKQSTR